MDHFSPVCLLLTFLFCDQIAGLGAPVDAPVDTSKTVCTPGWKTEKGDKFYEDAKCDRYPKYCETFKPNEKAMELMMKEFKCEYFDKKMIRQIKKAQDLAQTASGKCMWDIMLCYLMQCLGTLSDKEIKKVAQKLKDFEKKHNG